MSTTGNGIHMKDSYVVDTMAVVLRLEKRMLSVPVKEVFARAEAGDVDLFIRAMVLAEIGYLSEKTHRYIIESRHVLCGEMGYRIRRANDFAGNTQGFSDRRYP